MRAHFPRVPESETLDTLTLTFSKKELDGYVALRCAGLTRKSKNWLLKAAAILWGYAKGEVTKASADALPLATQISEIESGALQHPRVRV